MATFVSNLLYFLLAGMIFVFIATTSFDFYYDKPGPNDHQKLIVIDKGQSVANIASHLKDLNLIENRLGFMLVVRLKGFHDQIKFGEYIIPRTASIKEIIDKLTDGVSVQHAITIPEGLSTISVVDLVNKDQRIRGDLINATDEGVFAPNTYSFDITSNKEDLFFKMRKEQKKNCEYGMEQ